MDSTEDTELSKPFAIKWLAIKTSELVTLLQLCCLSFSSHPKGLEMLTQILLLREREKAAVKMAFYLGWGFISRAGLTAILICWSSAWNMDWKHYTERDRAKKSSLWRWRQIGILDKEIKKSKTIIIPYWETQKIKHRDKDKKIKSFFSTAFQYCISGPLFYFCRKGISSTCPV